MVKAEEKPFSEPSSRFWAWTAVAAASSRTASRMVRTAVCSAGKERDFGAGGGFKAAARLKNGYGGHSPGDRV